MWKTGVKIQFLIVTGLALLLPAASGLTQSSVERRIASQATEFADNLDSGGVNALNRLIGQGCAERATVNSFRARMSNLGKVKARRTTLVRSGGASSSVSDWSAKRSSRFGSAYNLAGNQYEVQFYGLSDVGSVSERYIFAGNTRCPGNLQLIRYDYLDS